MSMHKLLPIDKHCHTAHTHAHSHSAFRIKNGLPFRIKGKQCHFPGWQLRRPLIAFMLWPTVCCLDVVPIVQRSLFFCLLFLVVKKHNTHTHTHHLAHQAKCIDSSLYHQRLLISLRKCLTNMLHGCELVMLLSAHTNHIIMLKCVWAFLFRLHSITISLLRSFFFLLLRTLMRISNRIELIDIGRIGNTSSYSCITSHDATSLIRSDFCCLSR